MGKEEGGSYLSLEGRKREENCTSGIREANISSFFKLNREENEKKEENEGKKRE